MPGRDLVSRKFSITVPVALLALALLLLPSCVTARMWAGDSNLQSDRLTCEVAELLPADPGAVRQIALRLSAESAVVIGATERLLDGPVWILLQPEEEGSVTQLLQRVQADAENVAFDVGFRPAPDAGPRSVGLRLSAEFRLDLDRTGIEDVRPSRQARRRHDVQSDCRWRAQARRPAAGAAIAPPVVRVQDYRRSGLGVPTMVILTPVTVACDLVLLPVEILGAIVLALAG